VHCFIDLIEEIKTNDLIQTEVDDKLFENLQNEDFLKKIKQYFGDDLAQECAVEYNFKKEYLLKNSTKIIDNFKKNKAKIIKILDKHLLIISNYYLRHFV
jgi:hypothetical protein